MSAHYENFLVYSGERYSVFFHGETNESSKVYDYYKDCNDATRASLLFLVKRIADIGHIYDETKFRIEDRANKIYCFKPKKERFFCFFFSGQKIIITSGHTKKKQKLDQNELQKAIKIREEYL
ncbi:MAG: type II toxin-antitoxin system RelE/ParE family toxin [Candidatus Omnitrophica bacterium]|nr:type II toxin-antitoxin system RelE/ParE family toxin [Candidatus Omnitrophota bacterium]